MPSGVTTYINRNILISPWPKDSAVTKVLPTSPDEDLLSFYSNTYESVDVAHFLLTERRERLFGLINLVRHGEYFLDVGCANGAHMEELCKRGIHGVGIDVSVPNILKGLEQRPHLKFVHGFAEDIPFGDAYFDVAIIGDVLEHFRDPELAVAEILRVTKTGIAVCFPNSAERTLEHINPVTVSSFMELCALFALEVVFFTKDGQALPEADESFMWCFARAHKSATTDRIIQSVLNKNKQHLDNKYRVLNTDQWEWGETHQRHQTEIDRFNCTSIAIRGKNVLEIASGNGDLSVFLAKLGFYVTGIDISTTGVSQATNHAEKENVADRVRFLSMDATKLDFQDNTFDSIILPEVIEHVTSSRRYIEEAIRVLKPGGRIIISVPDTLEVPWPGHIRLFTKTTLWTEMEQYSDDIIWYDMSYKKWLLCAFTPTKKQGSEVADDFLPLINILMPTYNRPRLIRNAIDSIVQQTYKNWKLLVLNDGGEDIEDVLTSYRDNRIHYYRFDHAGKAATLNHGIGLIDDGYITYLDDDDIVFPNHLEALVRAALLNDKAFTYSDTYLTSIDGDSGKILNQIIENTADVDSASLKFFNQINHKQILHTKTLSDTVGLYDENLRVLIDYDYIKRLAFVESPYHVKLITGNHFLYYHNGAITTITGNWDRNPKACGESLLSIFKKHPLDMCALYRTSFEQVGQLATLSQAVAERDGQVTALSQAVAERDGQVEIFNRIIGERDAFIHALTSSRSWKITGPLRIAGRILSGGWPLVASGLRKYLIDLFHGRLRGASTNIEENADLPIPTFIGSARASEEDYASKRSEMSASTFDTPTKRKIHNLRVFLPKLIKRIIIKVLPLSWSVYLAQKRIRWRHLKNCSEQKNQNCLLQHADSLGTPESYDIICFPIIEWDHRFQRPQQLMSLFAKHGHRVFYLDLTFQDRSASVEWRQVSKRIFQIQLPGPSNFDRFYQSLPPAIAAHCLEALERFCADAGIKDAICMVQLPVWTPLALGLSEKTGWKVLFDCMDEHQGLTILQPEMLYDESLLVRKADLLIVSATKLWEKHTNQASRCILLPNAVDFDHFNCSPSKRHELESVKRPIIGYYGAIMEWFDAEVVIGAAKTRPDWTFVLIGNVDTPSVEPLNSLPNVLFLGEQPYSLLPGFLHQFDVCLIPFKASKIIESTNPVKFYEYMSAGKPVVATPIPELLPYQSLFYLARNAEELVAQVTRALQEDSPERVSARVNWARQETWQARYEQLVNVIDDLYDLVSIVIVSYQNLDKLRMCLESIIEKTHYPRYEVIVVDNGSSPDVIEYLRSIAQTVPNFRVIFNQSNLGFARANNIGLSAISEHSKHVILLNNDTVVTHGWISGLTKWLDNPDVGLVGPVTCPSGAANEAAVPVDYVDLSELEAFARRYTTEHNGKAFDIPMLAMYCLAMRRTTYEEVGPLDEQFGLGMFEDDDYSLRVRIKGYRVICAEDVFIHHFGRASFSQLNNRKYKQIFEQNQRLFEAKWNIKWRLHAPRQSECDVVSL